MAEKENPRLKNPRYYEKSGKIYDAGVEISEKEAEAQLARNAERRAKNQATMAKASKDDPMGATVMQRFHDIANRDFDNDARELQPILDKRKANKK